MSKTVRLLGGPANGSTVAIPDGSPPCLRVLFYGPESKPDGYSIDVGHPIRLPWDPLSTPRASVCEYVPAGLPLAPDVWAPREFVRTPPERADFRPLGLAGPGLRAYMAHEGRLIADERDVIAFAKAVEVRALAKVNEAAERALGLRGVAATDPVTPSRAARIDALVENLVAVSRQDGGSARCPALVEEARRRLVSEILK
jgi:hypothetical protein